MAVNADIAKLAASDRALRARVLDVLKRAQEDGKLLETLGEALHLLDLCLEAVDEDETQRAESWPDEDLDLTLGQDIREFLEEHNDIMCLYRETQ